MVAKKKGTGGGLTRSQVVTVRFDPKLKFAAELAARKQRRTISSFIEWSVEQAINGLEVAKDINFKSAMDLIWDVEEADRFVKLALHFPELLTYEEEHLWKLIRDFSQFWCRDCKEYAGVIETNADFDLIRFNWKTLQKIVAGEADPSSLSAVPF